MRYLINSVYKYNILNICFVKTFLQDYNGPDYSLQQFMNLKAAQKKNDDSSEKTAISEIRKGMILICIKVL